MNRSMPIFGLGFFFIVIGAGLFALTLRKGKPAPANPNKTQLRELVALQEEKKKMRVAAGIVAGFGAALIAIS